MNTVTMYGIPNCVTIRKARAFLAERSVEYQFHDYKKLGVPLGDIDRWIEKLSWQRLVNRQGNIWRKLDPQAQAAVVDVASAKALMLAQPSVVKRPVLAVSDELLVGFDADAWLRALA